MTPDRGAGSGAAAGTAVDPSLDASRATSPDAASTAEASRPHALLALLPLLLLAAVVALVVWSDPAATFRSGAPPVERQLTRFG